MSVIFTDLNKRICVCSCVCVCVRAPGHPNRSGQLCDQPLLRLPAFADRCRSGWRVCAGLRSEDGPQWMVVSHHHFLITLNHFQIYDFSARFYFTVSTLSNFTEEHTWQFLWAFTPTPDSCIIHFSNLYLLYVVCHKSLFGVASSFNGPRAPSLVKHYFNFSPWGGKQGS